MNIQAQSTFPAVDSSDVRWQAVRHGLDQLTTPQIQKIMSTPESGMVLDTFNYDEQSGLWCPLAIGLSVPEAAKVEFRSKAITNAIAMSFICEVGDNQARWFDINPLSGIDGKFFTQHRYADLLLACKAIVATRCFPAA